MSAKASDNVKTYIFKIINWKTTVICFVATALSIMGIYATIMGFIGTDNKVYTLLSEINFIVKIIILLVCSAFSTLIKLLISFIIHVKSLIIEKDDIYVKYNDCLNILNDKNEYISSHSDSICAILEEAINRKRYQEVISIGAHLSLPLWYTGKYALRIKVGQMVELASGQTGDKKVQALTLIEDIGWTNVRLNNIEEGEKYIKRGLRIATDIKDKYLIAQANRNLADICLINSQNSFRISEKTNFLNNCEHYLNESLQMANSMENSIEKEGLIGNIYYTYCKYYQEANNIDIALEYLDKSLNQYKNCGLMEKQIKLFVLKGKLLLDLNKEDEAIDVFQEGLRLSQNLNVNVHIATNALELCKIHISKNNIQLAKQMLSIAKEIINVINDPLVLSEYNDCVKKIVGEKA